MPAVAVQPLNPVSWLLTPALMCAVASLALALPIRIFGLQPPEPVFAMAPVFAWAVIRPSVLAPAAAGALGLFQDLLWGGPLGLWPLSLLVLYGAAFAVRPILSGQGFWTLWAWYGAACALSFGAGLILAALAAGVVPSLLGLALQFAVTLPLFPLSWRLIERFDDADVRFR
jgi:rod shape-determining protein MreD